jgi:hypothetical protein
MRTCSWLLLMAQLTATRLSQKDTTSHSTLDTIHYAIQSTMPIHRMPLYLVIRMTFHCPALCRIETAYKLFTTLYVTTFIVGPGTSMYCYSCLCKLPMTCHIYLLSRFSISLLESLPHASDSYVSLSTAWLQGRG